MSRLVCVLLLTAVGLALFAASATACLNDRESAKSEKEFKSSYGDPPSPPSDAPPYSTPTDRLRLLLYGGTGVGAALLVGGLTVTLLPRRRV